MTSSTFPRAGVLLALLALSLPVPLPGCANERPAINRVQPDFLDKDSVAPAQFAALQQGQRPGALSVDVIRREAQWFHQVTIIDKPPTTGGRGISSYTQVERIYWEVTQNALLARQAYDRLAGAQADPARPPVSRNPRQGEIVAAYAITSHFDIRRSYNPQTGEELNIVEENTTDRPWYLRRYMRVDWSRNLVGEFSPLASTMWDGRLRAEGVATFFNTPDDPNRPVFDYGDFNGQRGVLRYFDITNRTILHPEEATIPGLQGVPVCFLYDRISEACEPADVLMRVAFLRADPSRDFAPQSLDGHRMERFGFFNESRHGFNEHLGTPGQLERRFFADRLNLWQQHHARPAAGALDHRPGDARCAADADCIGLSRTARCDARTRTCGEIYLRCAPNERTSDPTERQRQADDQCAAVGSGAACDLDIAYIRPDRLGLCLLPYRQRTVRPIAYHLSQNYPDRIMPVTRQAVAEWDRVFRYAVQEARYRECLLDPQSASNRAACESWRDPRHERTRDSRHVYIGCHNPVWGTDPNLPGAHPRAEVDRAREAGWDTEACGPQGTSARLGDIRYHMIASINEYDQQGPWGLAGITGDPETGEVFAGRGSVWLTVTDSQASFAADMIRVLNRDVTPERFSMGQTVLDAYDYIRSLGGREERTGGRVPFFPRPVHRDIASPDELATILAQTRLDHLVTLPPEAAETLDANSIRELSRDTDGRHTDRALLRNLLARHRETLPHSAGAESSQSRWGRVRGTPLESALVGREALLGAGADPDAPSPASLEAASPARRNNRAFRALQERFQLAMEEHECRYDPQAFGDDVITVMLHRFRQNEVPADVRFGQTWNFHQGDPAPCPEEVGVDGEGRSNCPLNYEEVQKYLVQFIHYGVLLHEIGHSVGERHNFAASADSINYFDPYWRMRVTAGTRPGQPRPRADAIRPRWEHMAQGQPFYSQEEERGGVEEYGYSSVMDYKGWNEDAHGLGRYDRAFILHGYVDMVEAFDRVANPSESLIAFEAMTGGYQSSYRIGFAGDGSAPRAVSYHYTDVPRLVGLDAQGLPNVGDANRFPVFLRETARQPYGAFDWDPDHTNVSRAGRDGTRAATPHVLVPYMFATDDWANRVWNNQRYDAGADMFESMRYVSRHYLDYYFANAFARGRASFTVNGYRARAMGRYLDQAYYAMRNFVYLSNIYQNAYGTSTLYAPVFESNPVASGRLGAAMIVDMFANALLMPQSSATSATGGRHAIRTRVDGTQVWERSGAGSNTVLVPLGAGRDYSTHFDFASGFFWRYRILNAGAYHDKQLALDYLTDTFNWVPGRTVIEFTDLHPLQINMYTIYPGQTLRFFGSILSRDHDDIAPQIRPRTLGEPDILRTQIALLNLPPGTGRGQNGRDPGLRAIDPNLGFTLELETLTYLATQLELTFDRSARLSARVWLEGDTWALPDTMNRQLISFTNPFTGVRYSAVHIGGGRTEPGAHVGLSRRDTPHNETGIAARMLLHAARLEGAWRAAAPNVVSERRRELQVYIDLLDRMRDLSRMFN